MTTSCPLEVTTRLLDVEERMEVKEAFASVTSGLATLPCSALLLTNMAGEGVGDGEGGFSTASVRARFAGGSPILGLKKSWRERLPVVEDFGGMIIEVGETQKCLRSDQLRNNVIGISSRTQFI
jgi:hypothetical protein